ncbi:ABC transporter permease [Flavobacterium sp.]|uniref:ABC transporter permease n=1 Tax=Flavobacterium sp. TaxID=239 RepID=UPI0037516B98
MKRLLAIELQKIWKNKASRILTITYFGLLSLLAIISFIKLDFGPIHIDVAQQGVFNFPFIWHFNSFIAVYAKIFFAIIIVSMMANEYSYGTLKQNLIDGMSKKEFIASKFLTVIAFSVVSTVFVFITSLILGLIFSSYTELDIIFSKMSYLLAYFVNLIGFFSFCLFLGILIKRSAFALGFLFIWFIIECFLVYSNFHFSRNFLDFLPLESMSCLLIEPFSKLSVIKNIGSQIGIQNTKDYTVHFTTILIVLVWTAIFISLSYFLLKKRDL